MINQKQRFIVVIGFFSVLFCTSIGFSTSLDEVETQINQTKKKLNETKKRESSVLGSLIRTQKDLEKIDTNLSSLNSKIGTTERQIPVITAQLNTAQLQFNELKTQIGGRQGVLNERLKALYTHGYQSVLEILFSAESFSEFISRFEMIGRYVKIDLHILRALQDQQDLIIKKKNEIVQKQRELAAQKSLYLRLQNQNKQELSRKLIVTREKQKELEMLQSNRQTLERALDELEQTSKEVESQIREYQNSNQLALGTGSYIWPVQGRVIQLFGWRIHPILRKRKFHTGIDITSPQGTPIKAADSGVIIFAGYNGGYGKMIAIDHGSGFSSLYAHCSLLLVDKGQTVTKDHVIANVGSTGLSTGPHLHFEIRKGGAPVNPREYL